MNSLGIVEPEEEEEEVDSSDDYIVKPERQYALVALQLNEINFGDKSTSPLLK